MAIEIYKQTQPSFRKGISMIEEYGIEKAKEIKQNISKSLMGKLLSEKHRQNISKGLNEAYKSGGRTGQQISEGLKRAYASGDRKSWNKGLTKEIDDRIAQSAQKIGQAHKGRKRPKYIGEKISKIKKEKGSSQLVIENMRKVGRLNKGTHWSKERREKVKGKKLTKQHIKNAMKRRIPTSLEDKFMGIVDKYNLPYVYTGDGSFILDNCNPDFINIDGKKIAVEVYCRFYKQLGDRSIEDWKKKRINIFKKYGWELFFFDEIALNKEKNILKVLEV